MLLLFFPPKGLGGLLGPNPVHSMGEGQGTPWMSRQLIAGPLLMASSLEIKTHTYTVLIYSKYFKVHFIRPMYKLHVFNN